MVSGYGSGVSGSKVKSRDCALASDLVRATKNQVTLYVLVLRKQLTFAAVVHIVHNLGGGGQL